MVALAALSAATDQPCAASLLAAVPNQAEVTRIGAEALVVRAHELYPGPGYWNPLRPDLPAEQHLADTAQLSTLVTAAAGIAAGQQREAALLTELLAELTRGAPNQPALRTALDELLATALPRIVHLTVTAAPAELADLASLALQQAPQPELAATLADQMPGHSIQSPRSLPPSPASKSPTTGRARPTEGRTRSGPIPGPIADQPGGLPRGPGPTGGRGADRGRGSRWASTGSWPRPARTRSGPT